MPVAEAGVIIPDFPAFSQGAAAELLKVYRSNVAYWIKEGKLGVYKDNLGEQYIVRAELVRFVREYLRRSVND